MSHKNFMPNRHAAHAAAMAFVGIFNNCASSINNNPARCEVYVLQWSVLLEYLVDFSVHTYLVI